MKYKRILLKLSGEALMGDEGFDIVDYSTSESRVAVRLWTGLGIGGDAQNDTISDVEGVIGSDHNDKLVGDFGQADLLVGGLGDDHLKGLSGADTLIGGEGADTLEGDEGIDTADYSNSESGVTMRLWTGIGVGGDAQGDVLTDVEVLIGSQFDDKLVGAFGQADMLSGGLGDDHLRGLSGADTLEGGEGSDTLEGDESADVLRGGEGLDFLTGGADADSFEFTSVADAGLGAARDQILDFTQTEDVIDVSAVASGAFAFVGTAGFSTTGIAELRLIEAASGSTIVQMDVDGDGLSDGEIHVDGVVGLTATEFVL